MDQWGLKVGCVHMEPRLPSRSDCIQPFHSMTYSFDPVDVVLSAGFGPVNSYAWLTQGKATFGQGAWFLNPIGRMKCRVFKTRLRTVWDWYAVSHVLEPIYAPSEIAFWPGWAPFHRNCMLQLADHTYTVAWGFFISMQPRSRTLHKCHMVNRHSYI